MPIDADIAIYAILGTIIVLLGLWIVRLEIKIKRLLVGKNARSLEDSFVETKRRVEELLNFQNQAVSKFQDVDKRLKRSIQSVETDRFNPFRGTGSGGNQSFASAFVNEEGDGVVISGLYARDRVSVFSKPLKKFSSEFEITPEENQVLSRARENLLQK